MFFRKWNRLIRTARELFKILLPFKFLHTGHFDFRAFFISGFLLSGSLFSRTFLIGYYIYTLHVDRYACLVARNFFSWHTISDTTPNRVTWTNKFENQWKVIIIANFVYRSYPVNFQYWLYILLIGTITYCGKYVKK